MENFEEKFKNIMKKSGLEKLIKPAKYLAEIYNPISRKSEILKEFKTKEEFEEWYKVDGAAYEDAIQERIKLTEVFEEETKEEKFKKMMEKEGLEKMMEKPKEVYIARFIDPYGEPIVLEEFDTKKEFDDWYRLAGKAVEDENGGRIKMDFGPSELGLEEK